MQTRARHNQANGRQKRLTFRGFRQLLLHGLACIVLVEEFAEHECGECPHPKEYNVAVCFNYLSEDLCAPGFALYAHLKKVLGTFYKVFSSRRVLRLKPLLHNPVLQVWMLRNGQLPG